MGLVPLPALLPLMVVMMMMVPLVPAPRAPLTAPGSARTECGSHCDGRAARPGSGPSWIWAYVPLRSCHRVLRDKHGHFSPPAYRSSSPLSFWCNWTIWAGARQHIVVYIQGFAAQEACATNEDKILFEGVSSLAADGAVYACWGRGTHVFATFAAAVHVVLLKTYLPRRRDARFRGTYFVFQHREAAWLPGEHPPPATAAPRAPARARLVESGPKGVPEDLGRTWGGSRPLPETPLLGALQGEEPFLGRPGAGLESRRPFRQPTEPGEPWLGITPTPAGGREPALPPRDSSPGGAEAAGAAASLRLRTAGPEEAERCPPWSGAAGGAGSAPAESLLPSLALPGELLRADRSSPPPGRGLAEPLPRPEPQLRTSVLQPPALGEPGTVEPSAALTARAEGFTGRPAPELAGAAEGREPPSVLQSAPGTWPSAAGSAQRGGGLGGPLVGPGVRKPVLDDGGGAGSGWRAQAPAPATRDLRQPLPDLQLGTGLPPPPLPPPEELEAPSLPPAPPSLPPSPAPQGPWVPGGGQHHRRAELGPPWALEYLPVRSCHVVLQGDSGLFYPPPHSDLQTNVWCNWTIQAGPQKHVLIYIQGFQTDEGCDRNHDKMVFQGVLSSVETKVVHACYHRGTVIFAARATAVHVLLLSGAASLGSKYQHFRGQYYVFRDYGAVGSSDAMPAAQDISKVDISSGVSQPHGLEEGAHGGEFPLLEDGTELERSLGDGEGVLVEAAAAGGGAGRNTKSPAPDTTEGAAQLEPSWVPTAVGAPATLDVPVEAPKSSARPSAARIPPFLAPTRSAPCVGVAAVTRSSPTRMAAMEEPPLHTNVEAPPLHPSVGMTAGGTATTGDSQEDLLDLASVLASLENDTALRSQHHPGDLLFEVTVEIQHLDWVPRGGRELNKDLLESMKSHIQKNLKLSANRVNEIKLKEMRRAGRENLLLTFWLHLRPEQRNVSVALRAQLQELLGRPGGAERPRLVSLVVEDVDECGLGLCGEAAHCVNGVGTYLCRCKEDYEDRSPTRSGTLCVPAPRSGLLRFLQQPEVLAGAALSVGLLVVVAAVLALRRARKRRRSGGNPFPEERGAEPERVVLELSRLERCLRLEPLQLKVRARPPEWIARARGRLLPQEQPLRGSAALGAVRRDRQVDVPGA